MEGLSINEIEITKEDVVVTYIPSSSVINYSYIIIKNGEYSNPIYINSNTVSTINLIETGTYKIEITTYDIYGNTNIITSGEYKIDKEAPIINISEKTYEITSNEEPNIENITASDIVDGDLTNNIKSNIDSIDFNREGVKRIEYTVEDKAGNITTETVFVTVKKDNTNIVKLGQISIILIVFILLILLMKYIKSVKLEKRFSKYTINSSKNKSISLLDNLNNIYIKINNKLSILLSKSIFIKNSSKRYQKYVDAFDLDYDSMNIISRKIIVGIIYLIVVVIANLFNSKLIQPYEMLIPFILGFYTLDIIYMFKYGIYKKKIESDMLKAITVMNNSFKSGRSIIQSIDLVSKELDGPIAKEFKKISMEISLGLDIEVAFKRFSDRIKLSEAVYLTSSLSVLNKTGGNIIKVFDSIEKTLFSRRKLQLELKSLTSSSKLIMYVLILVPVLFVIFINIINPGYFLPLFSSGLGLILIGIMIIIYITYILVVNRVMRVRM